MPGNRCDSHHVNGNSKADTEDDVLQVIRTGPL